MSTMSLLRDINVKGKRKVKTLVEALERSERDKPRRVEFSRPVREIPADRANEFLAKVKW